MIVLSCNNISKYFGIDLIIKNITFSINEGEKVGLVGINGAGKSTLFKILCQELPYDDGDLYIARSTQIGYLEQNNVLNSKKNIYDEVITVFTHLIEMEDGLRSLEKEIAHLSRDSSSSPTLQILMDRYSHMLEAFDKQNGYGFRSEVRGVLRGLGFSEEEFSQPIGQLSGGEKTRVSLAKLLISKPDILMLDEPTNHLDIEAVEWLEGFLRDYSGTVLMISHDRYFLDQLVTRVMEIENRELMDYNGNYTEFVKRKKVLREQELKAYLEQEKEINRQKDMIRRLSQHGTEKLITRAKSKQKQLSKIEELDKPAMKRDRAKIRFNVSTSSGRDVLSIEDLSKSFDDTHLFSNVSFDIYRGERVALIGPNGVGKSTLFKILLEKINKSGGQVRIGHNVNLAYYDQEQADLSPSNQVIDEIWNDHRYMVESEIRTLLGSFLFKADDVFKKVTTLSGGEKARLSLLKLILSESNLLLLDEPTNHLDIDSKEVLEDALLQYDGTIFFISHDRYFLNRMASKIIELNPNGSEIYLGNYDYYVEKKKELSYEDVKIEEKTRTQVQEERRKEREKQRALRELNKKREGIEGRIMELEARLEELDLLMCQEEIYSNPKKSREIHQEVALINEQLEGLYSEWAELE